MDSFIDRSTPIVVLFGPPCSGKFSIMRRLSLYLEQEGFTVLYDILHAEANEYDKSVSDRFDRYWQEIVRHQYEPRMVNFPSSILLHVMGNKGRKICQLLYINGQICTNDIPHHNLFNELKCLNNRIIWALTFDINSQVDENLKYQIRDLYVDVAHSPYKTIVICNKVDLIDKRPNLQRCYKHMNETYSFEMEFLEKIHPKIFGFLHSKNKMVFNVFSSGVYIESSDHRQYVVSNNIYPQSLWNSILSLI